MPGTGVAATVGGVFGVVPGVTIGRNWVPRSCTQTVKLFWHLAEHNWRFWTNLFFGMGVKLPAKLVAIEENRIIAATFSFICTLLKAGVLTS